MKILIQAKPNSKKEFIKRIDQPSFEFNENRKSMKGFMVAVKEPPIKGKANQAIVKILAEYFQTSKQNIKIISGFSSKNKILEINNKFKKHYQK